MGDNLKQKMVGALTWSSIDRFGQQAIQLIIGMILSRLLSPDDFGLLGLVMIFSALSFVLVESGFGQALIRKTDVNETDYNTIFYFNISASFFLYVILFFISPFIAAFFEEPKLTFICRILFTAIIFNSFYLIPLSKLGRVLDYKTIAKVNLISTILSGVVGVAIAVAGFGVWALILQQVSYHFLRMVFFHFFVKWKPAFLFSFKVIRDFRKILGVQSVDEKKSRDKHSHHAIDAAVLALIPVASKRDKMLELFYKIQEEKKYRKEHIPADE
jgi:O-antigen/teichoic acid export membrane protein